MCIVLLLQGIAGDIHAHEKAYEELCSKCQELVGRGMQDAEELQQKLDNLQRRWNALQVRRVTCSQSELRRDSYHVTS